MKRVVASIVGIERESGEDEERINGLPYLSLLSTVVVVKGVFRSFHFLTTSYFSPLRLGMKMNENQH